MVSVDVKHHVYLLTAAFLIGFQARSRGGRWSWAAKVGLLSLRVVPQQQCKDIVLVTLSSTAVETANARCTSRCAMARGHSLKLPLFWRRSTVSPVFFGRCPRSSLHSFVLSPAPPSPPPHPVPVPLISNLASVDVKQYGRCNLLINTCC